MVDSELYFFSDIFIWIHNSLKIISGRNILQIIILSYTNISLHI